jgi:predicted metal-binding membrane protein
MASSAELESLGKEVPAVGKTGEEPRLLVRSLPLRDRVIILSGLGIVTLLAWVYLAGTARFMGGVSSSGSTWTATHFVAMLAMWVIMMVGMMVPSAIPMVLIHAAISHKGARAGETMAPTGLFVTGYVLIWSLFGVGATVAQWGLDRASLLSPMMMTKSPIAGGILLLAAGLYQLTPVKNVCLRHCQSPVHFIANSWQPGFFGAVRMGLTHGAYCLGCCWILMSLLFFGGVMSIWWIGGITLFVLLEKVVPFGRLGGRILGLLVAGWGVVLVISGVAAR